MTTIAAAAEAYQRARWTRENAHLWIRHDAYRFMPPGAPRYVGRDVVKYFLPEGEAAGEPVARPSVAAGKSAWADAAGKAAVTPALLRSLTLDQKLALIRDDDDLRRQALAVLRTVRAELAALRFELTYRQLQRKAGFNPDQPRVPAGHRDGGQWTREGGGVASTAVDRLSPVRIAPDNRLVHDDSGEASWRWHLDEFRPDGSLARQAVANRDGSTILSVFSASPETDGWDERHTVTLADGNVVTFENAGPVQTVFDGEGNQLQQTVWTPDGPEPQATVQLAQFAPAIPGPPGAVFAGAAILYGWWSSQNGPESRAILAFRAEGFSPGASRSTSAVYVGRLTSEEVGEVCPRYSEVQSILDGVTSQIHRGAYRSAQEYGTAVHHAVQVIVNGTSDPQAPPRDPNFRAEVSVLKSKEAGYSTLGSKRVDVLENPGRGSVCGHDIKTGRAGLKFSRALELASSIRRFYPGTRGIVITEVRPSR